MDADIQETADAGAEDEDHDGKKPRSEGGDIGKPSSSVRGPRRLFTLRVTGVMTQASLPKTSGLGIGWQAPVRGWSWPRAEVVGGGQATGVVGRWAPVSG